MNRFYKFLASLVIGLSPVFYSSQSIAANLWSDFYYKYECKTIDNLGITTDEILNLSQFTVFSYLSMNSSNNEISLFGRSVTPENDTFTAHIVKQIGPIENAFFFQDDQLNRYRIIIHRRNTYEIAYSGFLVNTVLEASNDRDSLFETIIYQQDLKCFKN